MFNPAFVYILQENEVINQEIMIKNILDFLGIVCIAFIFCGLYGVIVALKIPDIIQYVSSLFWNSLTPGQQWLEIAYIVSNLVTFISLLIFLTTLAENLDKEIRKIKEKIREREEKIAELESIINQNKDNHKEIPDEQLLEMYNIWETKNQEQLLQERILQKGRTTKSKFSELK